ncbi:acetyl-CoA carboxylase biotin carboxyl carrier protein [Actinomadura graeca]|uniref:Biotin carboxyl carrier protein of acetyl-CoA carboxylase n=1 Tax=Actinomadura graeca TaxID=2750812 RepID=A0ABX8QQN1_9ACTN|nr:biotin/lipoyl-containing protein [Actinomadura graeca]QXJ21103.1 acetyl-CoA carboxylase biotin carboxyl carrier protein [Actinomadura graeca]
MSTETTPSWQDILDLVALLDEGSYESAVVEFGDVRVRMSRSAEPPQLQQPAPLAQPVQAAAPAPANAAPVAQHAAPAPEPAAAPAPAVPATAVRAPAVPAVEGTTIPAPMIGVFFRSPSPGAPPFVAPGATVEPDTTIGIIEVMKLMNPVTAGVAGTLTDFLVKDNEQVEFGQPLAVVAEAGAS